MGVIDAKYLKNLDKFGKDLSKHFQPIKYEAITPDLFILCGRTTGKDGNEHSNRKIIDIFYGNIIDYLNAYTRLKFVEDSDDTYKALSDEIFRSIP